MKKVLTLSVVVLLLVTLLAACSGGKSLTAFAEEQNKTLSAMNTDDFSVGCSAEGKTLIVTYGFKTDVLTQDLAQTMITAGESSFSSFISAAKTAGYDCDTVRVDVKDKDGKVIATKDIK